MTAGVTSGFHFQGPAELAVQFQDGSARGGHPEETPFGGWRWLWHSAGQWICPRHFPGDHGKRPQAEAVVEAVFHSLEAGETQMSSMRRSAPKGSLVKAKKER